MGRQPNKAATGYLVPVAATLVNYFPRLSLNESFLSVILHVLTDLLNIGVQISSINVTRLKVRHYEDRRRSFEDQIQNIVKAGLTRNIYMQVLLFIYVYKFPINMK